MTIKIKLSLLLRNGLIKVRRIHKILFLKNGIRYESPDQDISSFPKNFWFTTCIGRDPINKNRLNKLIGCKLQINKESFSNRLNYPCADGSNSSPITAKNTPSLFSFHHPVNNSCAAYNIF
jgi:hypothetical protein